MFLKKWLCTRTRTRSNNQASLNPPIIEGSRFTIPLGLSSHQRLKWAFLVGRIRWTIWVQAQLQGFVKGICACIHFAQWLSTTKVSNIWGGENTCVTVCVTLHDISVNQALSFQWTLALSLLNNIARPIQGTHWTDSFEFTGCVHLP